MAVKSVFLSSLIIFISLFISCNDAAEDNLNSNRHRIGNVTLFTFTSDSENILTSAQPFVLNTDTSVKSALEKLGLFLAETFFLKTYSNEITNIHFKVLRIDEIPTASGRIKIAIINMIDDGNYAMKYFFQGSTGAQITFHMLVATFIQPQLTPSLVDGLIILYNGELLPEMDHINLSGILIPRLVKHVALRAIYNTKTEEAGLCVDKEETIGLKL